METIVLAGGCFWCTEAVFRRLKGVKSVTSGYANGGMDNPSYEDVSSGRSGFAEAVQISFDPSAIKLEHILDIFWAMHDPTSLNKQGNDIGPQYRSAILFENESQKKIAIESKEKQSAVSAKLLGKEVLTEIAPLKNFFTAEEYHQNYYEQNRNKNPYCSLVIDPKIEKLLEKFGNDVKEEYK